MTGVTQLDVGGVRCERESDTRLFVYNLQKLVVDRAARPTITLNFYLVASLYSVVPKFAVTTFYERARTHRVDYSADTNLAPTLTADTESVLQSFEMLTNPSYDYYKPQAGYQGHFQFNFSVSFTGAVDVQQMRLQLAGFDLHPSLNLLRCVVNATTRVPCTYEQLSGGSVLGVTLTLEGFLTVVSGESYSVYLNTEHENAVEGLVYPTVQGEYPIKVQFYSDLGATLIEEFVHVLQIEAPELGSLEIYSNQRYTSQKNIFEVFFKAPVGIPAYASGGRIQVVFPTVDFQGQAFPVHLGFEKSDAEVGCWVDETKVPRATAGVPVTCRLVSTGLPDEPAVIEVQNFAAVTAGDLVELMLVGITNPAGVRNDVDLAVRLRTTSGI